MLLICPLILLGTNFPILLRRECNGREHSEGKLSIPRPSGHGMEPGSCGDFASRKVTGVSHSCQGQSHSGCPCSCVVVMSSTSDQLTSALHSSLCRAAMKFRALPPSSTPEMGSDLPNELEKPYCLATVIGVGFPGLNQSTHSCLLATGIGFVTASWSISGQRDVRGNVLDNLGCNFPLSLIP